MHDDKNAIRVSHYVNIVLCFDQWKNDFPECIDRLSNKFTSTLVDPTSHPLSIDKASKPVTPKLCSARSMKVCREKHRFRTQFFFAFDHFYKMRKPIYVSTFLTVIISFTRGNLVKISRIELLTFRYEEI
jgi:hypothetical protein